MKNNIMPCFAEHNGQCIALNSMICKDYKCPFYKTIYEYYAGLRMFRIRKEGQKWYKQ